MRKNSSCKFHFPLQILLLLSAVFVLPDEAISQKRQLTPSDTVSKVAFIDHSRLRKEYKAFSEAMKELSKENDSKKKTFDESLKVLENQTSKQLKSDSLKGGKDYEKISSQASVKRKETTTIYQADLKKRFQGRNILFKEYERKIVLAIESVVSEGGFTEVKPFIKEPFEKRGTNITDQILKKLN